MTDETNDFVFIPELNCDPGTDYKIAEYLLLQDSNADYVDLNGELS